MKSIAMSSKSAEAIFNQLKEIKDNATKPMPQGEVKSGDGQTFTEHLKQGLEDVNKSAKKSDHMAAELATGKSGNIHETMLAATQAELSFNLMVQIRNKALEAYTEIMRMPV